jgi:hypothetical protein
MGVREISAMPGRAPRCEALYIRPLGQGAIV